MARLCRTPEDSFQAGWDDGADDAPMTPAEVTRIAALWAPAYRAQIETREVDRPRATTA